MRVRCAACQEEGRDGCKLCGLLSFTKATWSPQQGATDPMTTDIDTELDELASQLRRITVKVEPRARDTRTIANTLGVVLERLAATRAEVRALGAAADAEREAERRFAEELRTRGYDADCAANVRIVDLPPDPRPLLRASKLKHGPGGTGAAGMCDSDCAKCAAEAGGASDLADRFEAHCRTISQIDQLCIEEGADAQYSSLAMVREALESARRRAKGEAYAERDALKTALREVIDDAAGLLAGMRSGTWQKPSDSKLDSKLARLAELRRLL